jgi:CheY-like chemotaxis protein
MLGGDIEVVSAEGAGSTFTLTIPAVAVAPELPVAGLAPTDAAGERGPTGIAGMRVLLAEDGLDNQRLVSRLLQRAGAVVTVANNGRIAVEALCEDGDAAKPLRSPSPFDLVLLDMQMPEMDGYEAATLLRAKGFARSVVALTANALSGDRERCLAAGCDEYVRKPIDRSALFAACRRAMSVRGDA